MNIQTKMEIIDSIKFFGSVASTNGIVAEAKEKANSYITRLVEALEPEVSRMTAEASGLTLVTDEEETN